jgi:hypothetical protein
VSLQCRELIGQNDIFNDTIAFFWPEKGNSTIEHEPAAGGMWCARKMSFDASNNLQY